MVTAETVAEKVALVAPAATVTEEGTFTADELLERVTAWPPVGAAPLNVTVQRSVAAFVSEALAQLRLVKLGSPFPLTTMVEVVPEEELLVTVIFPVTALVLAELN